MDVLLFIAVMAHILAAMLVKLLTIFAAVMIALIVLAVMYTIYKENKR